MRRLFSCLMGLMLVMMLFSCVTGIRMDDIQQVHRGMSHDEFKSQVTIASKFAFPIYHKGIHYEIEIYPMQTGTRTQSSYVWTQSGGYTTFYEVPVYDDYTFVFDDKGLMFWGFMTELQKSDDELVLQLAPLISSKAKEQYQMQAQ
jgi:hypothetical protein